MNETLGKKLGEALAFARVGQETFERGAAGLTKIFLPEDYREITEDYLVEQQKIDALATQANGSAKVFKKATQTAEKLRVMRDMYIGDEWDNPVEVLEWLGFFEGAAIVHWHLVQGLAEKQNQKDIFDLAADSLSLHQAVFGRVSRAIKP